MKPNTDTAAPLPSSHAFPSPSGLRNRAEPYSQPTASANSPSDPTPARDATGLTLSAGSVNDADAFSKPPMSWVAHDFKTVTFGRPTCCNLCSQLIWGLVRQGQRCIVASHSSFQERVPSIAMLATQSASSAGRVVDGGAASSPSSVTTFTREVISTASSFPLESELITNVQAETDRIEQLRKEANPTLGLATLLDVNTKFVARQGPLVWIQDTLTEIIMWQNPPKTICCILAYIVVCLYPILFCILPQTAIIYVIAASYLDRARKMARGEPIPSPLPAGAHPKLPMTNAKYLAHLQHIQNTMINMVNLYDVGYEFYQGLNWSNPHRTLRVLGSTLVSMVCAVFLFWMVPLNTIMLWGGLGLFFANTVIIRAVGMTLAPVIQKEIERQIGTFKERISAACQVTSKEMTIAVDIFENQRWWAGSGFIPFLMHIERSAWSDDTGLCRLPPKDLYELPLATEAIETDTHGQKVKRTQVWEWIDYDWSIDFQWTSVNSSGWSFSDHAWKDARAKPTLTSFTRRRKWTRRMRMVQ
ncbi:hypothetical protein BSLG_007513 [Batrachochytrium salamandrivorans]|nr:hypothetical protein BSLG_007513 [Batrachochytrium salamandrivorans]